MSLTNIVYTPVDTGTAKVRLKGEKAKGRFFYLLAGPENYPDIVETGHTCL